MWGSFHVPRPWQVTFILWAVATTARLASPVSQGLQAQYFPTPNFVGSPRFTGLDTEISTRQLARRWPVMPETFSAVWVGHVIVERPGLYTFATTSDDGSRLFIDRRLVVDNGGQHGPVTQTGRIALDRGPHAVFHQYFQAGGPYVLEWAWSREHEPLTSVPHWALSPRPWSYATVLLERWLSWIWWALTLTLVLFSARVAFQSEYWTRRDARTERQVRASQLAVRVALLAGLAWLYVLGATEHAQRVNTFKSRGDQTSFLVVAKDLYANWHGHNPPTLGNRDKMPLYPAYQALLYDPALSDSEFFEVGKVRNIRLSLVLLAVLCVIFSWHLPPLVSTNLTLIVAFGYFVFKAGYVQPELLFYFLFFVTFLSFCRLLKHRGPTASVSLGILAGMLAALTHLTKAAMLPLVVIFLAVYGIREVALLAQHWRQQHEAGSRRRALTLFAWRAAAGALMVACFVGVLYPYISNSKRVFGRYFYNVNTTFYIWYDNWPRAGASPMYANPVAWLKIPPEQLPSMRSYWRTHTVGQILNRFVGGFQDMVDRSYQTFWYMKYVALYVVFTLAVIAANRRAFVRMIREHTAIVMFMLLYAAVYLPATAFYAPISDTGTTRFLLPHAAPLMFVLSCFFARPPFQQTRWTAAGVAITPAHFHVFVLVTIGLDLTFTLWPRLMTTYGGF